jgi:hypothetical protein
MGGRDIRPMALFSVTFVWKHTAADTAEVVVEAKNKAAARRMAKKITKDSKIMHALKWEEGGIIKGRYEVDRVKEADAVTGSSK